jgi:hypothetical protein
MRTSSSQDVKETLVDILGHLSPVQRRQVLDFVRFLRQQTFEPLPSLEETAGEVLPPEQRLQLNLVPATSMIGLTGLVSLGGDAVADTEALYNGNGRS